MPSTAKAKHVGNTVLPPGVDKLYRIKTCPCVANAQTTWSTHATSIFPTTSTSYTTTSGYRTFCPKCKGKGVYQYEVRAHWYYQTHVFCPICMRGKTYKERKYDFKPDDPKDRHEYVDRYCGCNG